MPNADLTEPHWARSALVMIDVQRDFLDGGSSPIPGTTEVLPHLARLAASFREAGRPIVHVIRLYEGEDVDLVRRDMVAGGAMVVKPGTPGADVPSELLGANVAPDPQALINGELQHVEANEVLMWKPRWSAFYRTPLDAHLRELEVDTVVVAGCNLPNCPRATMFDASARDYRVALVADAVSQATEERLEDAEKIGVHLMTTDAVLAGLGAM